MRARPLVALAAALVTACAAPASPDAPAELVVLHARVYTVDAARNRVLFTRLTEAGLWEVPLDLGAASVRQVSASVPTADRYRMWTVAPDGEIRYLERLQDCAASLRRIVPADPAPPRCLDQLRRSAVNGFSLGGPRNEAAYLALVDWDGADIGYMELPKETTEVVPGWVK